MPPCASAYFLATGTNPDPDAFSKIRGGKPWKEAVFSIPGIGEVRVAVVSGLANTRRLMEAVDSGRVEYDFVEVMACPGGCAGGGGQPIRDGAGAGLRPRCPALADGCTDAGSVFP